MYLHRLVRLTQKSTEKMHLGVSLATLPELPRLLLFLVLHWFPTEPCAKFKLQIFISRMLKHLSYG